MEEFLHKRTLAIYWVVLFCSGVFLYFDLPYTVITEPLLVPLLLLHLFLNDNNIGRPVGKFIFYIGLFLAFLGDTLQIVINNELFFLCSLVAFMLMNLCYSISFYSLSKFQFRRSLPVLIACLILFFIGRSFLGFLGKDLGDYRVPVIIYMISLFSMIALAVNVTANKKHRKTAITWLVPGSVIFMIQNAFLAINLFHFENNSLYVFSIIPYGIAQYLMVKGVVASFVSPQNYKAP